MKKEINAFEYAAAIKEAMTHGGVLLTTKAGEKVNTMTIGWGTMGVEWRKPIFTAYIRESRFTKEMLDQNGEFTVNIPVNGSCSQEKLTYCGKISGRDKDKIKEMDFHLTESDEISVPGIRELPMTLECRVLFTQVQDPGLLPEDIQRNFYPVKDGKQDRHVAFYAEILKAYLIEA